MRRDSVPQEVRRKATLFWGAEAVVNADMSTLEIRAGISFGVHNEKCGGWWEGCGEMEKPVGSDLRGMNGASLPCERDCCREGADEPGALCSFDAEELIPLREMWSSGNWTHGLGTFLHFPPMPPTPHDFFNFQ